MFLEKLGCGLYTPPPHVVIVPDSGRLGSKLPAKTGRRRIAKSECGKCESAYLPTVCSEVATNVNRNHMTYPHLDLLSPHTTSLPPSRYPTYRSDPPENRLLS